MVFSSCDNLHACFIFVDGFSQKRNDVVTLTLDLVFFFFFFINITSIIVLNSMVLSIR